MKISTDLSSLWPGTSMLGTPFINVKFCLKEENGIFIISQPNVHYVTPELLGVSALCD